MESRNLKFKNLIKSKKYDIALIAFIFLIGLIPLLWFKENQFITGTDVDFPPFPLEKLEKRLYTWDPILFKGSNKSNNMSTLTFVATSGLLSYIISNPVTVEKITFVIMFILTGLSMAYLLEKVFGDFKEDSKFIIKVFGVLIYMVNFYNVFLWVRLQLNVTSLIFIPVLFGVLYTIFSKNDTKSASSNKKLRKSDLLVLSIATILGGSLGQQPPIIYAVIISTILFILLYTLLDVFSSDKRKLLLSKYKELLVAGVVALLSGMYWILPQASFIFGSSLLKDSDVALDVYNIEELLAWTSSKSSNFNILRTIGDVVWLDGWANQPYFPELLTQYTSPLFIIASFLFVAVVFSPFFLAKEKRSAIIVFGSITLISIFFSKGIHPPFEGLFKLAFTTLPGFWIHRAPWQKFGMITIVGYSVLGAYGFYLCINFLKEKFPDLKEAPRGMMVFVLVVLYLSFNNLFVLGKMFPSKESDIGYHGYFNLGFHHTFPDYAYDIKRYLETEDKTTDYSILLLPELHTSVYNWGYGGSTDIVSIFTNRSTLFSPYGEGFVLDGYISNVYSDIVSVIYNAHIANDEILNNLNSVFDFYDIKYALQRNDFTYNFYGDMDSPAFLREQLNLANIDNVKSFGEWDLYDLEIQQSYPLAYTSNNLIDVSELQHNILLPIIDNASENKLLVSTKPEIALNYAKKYSSNEVESAEISYYENNYKKLDVDSSEEIIEEVNLSINKINKAQFRELLPDINNEQLTDLLNNLNENILITEYLAEDIRFNQEYEIEIINDTQKEILLFVTFTDYTDNSIIAGTAKIDPTNGNNTSENESFKQMVKTVSGVKYIRIFTLEIPGETISNSNVKLTRYFKPNVVVTQTINTNIEPDNNATETKMINPTKYKITLSEKNKSLNLVFNQTYNNLWKLYAIKGDTKVEIPQKQHFMANYYANAWHLTQEDLAQTDYLIVEFYLQRLFYIGTVITLGSFALILSINFIDLAKRHAK